MKYLTIQEVRYLSYELAKKTMTWEEPIPEFETRFPEKLESCLITPWIKFNKKYLYPGFTLKASMLFYLMIKNHPFQNGNKRIATASLLTLLYKNKYWLRVDNRKLYNFACWVAESDPEVKDAVIEATKIFIKKQLIKLK